MPDRVILSIGTKKGLFVAEAAKSRRRFELRGPFGSGVAVYAALRSHFKTPSPGICLRKPQGKQVYICSDGGF